MSRKYFWLIVTLVVASFIILGCDSLKCRPDVHPDKKGDEKGWFFGGKCGDTF